MPPSTSLALCLLLLVPTLSMAAKPARPPGNPTVVPTRPTVVVTLVVDQLAGWVAAERFEALPATGGLARLRREGTWIRELEYAHANTETAPGHASLYTGFAPTASGIFANELIGPDGQHIHLILDPEEKALTPVDLPTTDTGSPAPSLKVLRVPTLADRLRAKTPGAYIVSLSGKDRGALFAGGREPSASLWFDPRRRMFASSTGVMETFPKWAVDAGGPAAVAKAFDWKWEPLDPAWLAGVVKVVDDAPGEGDLGGYGKTFPHVASASKSPHQAWRAGPDVDRAVVDLALAALEARPPDAPVILLSLSFSGLDYVGHVFGADSHEHHDCLLRLDGQLKRLFDDLDVRFGADGWSALLSGDHGVPPMPEAVSLRCPKTGDTDRFERSCEVGARLFEDPVTADFKAAAVRDLGSADYIRGLVDPFIYLGPAALVSEAETRRALLWVRDYLRARPEMHDAFIVRDLPSKCPSGDSALGHVCRSVPKDHPLLRNAVYLVPKRGYFWDAEWTPGGGAGHGTHWRYDRVVTLLARSPGRIKRGQVVEKPAPFTTFTRTAASLLGIPLWREVKNAPRLVTGR